MVVPNRSYNPITSKEEQQPRGKKCCTIDDKAGGTAKHAYLKNGACNRGCRQQDELVAGKKEGK